MLDVPSSSASWLEGTRSRPFFISKVNYIIWKFVGKPQLKAVYGLYTYVYIQEIYLTYICLDIYTWFLVVSLCIYIYNIYIYICTYICQVKLLFNFARDKISVILWQGLTAFHHPRDPGYSSSGTNPKEWIGKWIVGMGWTWNRMGQGWA